MPPEADAVGLVHRDEPDREFRQEVLEAPGGEPLRRHEEEPKIAPSRACAEGVPGEGEEAGVEGRCRNPGLLRPTYLVLHEGDQGRHHQGHPTQEERRHLVTEALPPAGGEDPRASRPSRTARTSSSWPGRKAENPKRERRTWTGSTGTGERASEEEDGAEGRTGTAAAGELPGVTRGHRGHPHRSHSPRAPASPDGSRATQAPRRRPAHPVRPHPSSRDPARASRGISPAFPHSPPPRATTPWSGMGMARGSASTPSTRQDRHAPGNPIGGSRPGSPEDGPSPPPIPPGTRASPGECRGPRHHPAPRRSSPRMSSTTTR
jgi:hypothetical protein